MILSLQKEWTAMMQLRFGMVKVIQIQKVNSQILKLDLAAQIQDYLIRIGHQ